MRKQIFYLIVLAFVFSLGCKKESGNGDVNTTATGKLQDDASGDCLPKTINGTYIAGTAQLPATNTIIVQVNVTRTGSYTVYSDTINGYYFRATGTFTTLGANSVTLRGNGTPLVAGVNDFVVYFAGTICDIQITVLPANIIPASFTLVSGGSPVNCASAVVSGSYFKDPSLTSSHFVDVTVNVTVPGSYAIRAAGGGMIFQKTAVFAGLGNQTVRLGGSGIPVLAGPNTITFDPPFASCNFIVSVAIPFIGVLGGATGTCSPITINGTYRENVALTALNNVKVQITTNTIAPYNISTNTISGINFSRSGMSNGSTEIITLFGNGTPIANGIFNFTVSFGASTCMFSLPVAAAIPNAVYYIDCANVVVHGTYQVGLLLNVTNYITLPVTVVTPGVITILDSVNGMRFAGGGNFPQGASTITLHGNSIPLGPPNTYNLTVGTPSCIIPITVIGGPLNIDWSFIIEGIPYQGTSTAGQVNYDVNSSPPRSFLYYNGDNPNPDLLFFVLTDKIGGITGGEQYSSILNSSGNTTFFRFWDVGLFMDIISDPNTINTGNMLFTITSHNTITKTIIGIFQGTALDQVTQTIKTITSGTFKAVYP